MIRLSFDRGTVLVDVDDTGCSGLPGCVEDLRVGKLRAPGKSYRDIVQAIGEQGLELEDGARDYGRLDLRMLLDREPFPHQEAAVNAWEEGGRRGVVVLPTGSGKTFVAQLAMERASRPTLVVAPTIDLMQQWYGVLGTSFDVDVGLVGGGYHEPLPVTVTTYDSAYLHMERLGNRYGLLVFDECHHLPGPAYQIAAECSIAPFRLGLTATPEREDGQETVLDELVGPIVYRQEIKELAGEYLADYETVRLGVRLPPEELERYHAARETYLDFVRSHRIQLGSAGGWGRFLMLTSQSEAGRRAFLAFREQKTISQASGTKLRLLEKLLARHGEDRVLIFTNDNETVYRISRDFLIPAITHQTKVKERHETLGRFNAGDYPFLVTSKVLNEGVDVPAANIAIVLSGSGTVREHVQRLGRILRPAAGKTATLYEVVARETGEEFVSTRRRRHSAYG